jgi:hypothetical protein
MQISFARRKAASRCAADLAGVSARLAGATCPSLSPASQAAALPPVVATTEPVNTPSFELCSEMAPSA